MRKSTWAGIVATDAPVLLAADTEYEGHTTLTVQFAVRVGEEVRVQVYYAADVPPPPKGCFGTAFTTRFGLRVVVRPPQPITADLSPARVLADLFGLSPAEYLSRYEGDARRTDLSGTTDRPQANRKRTPESSDLDRPRRLDIVLVGHFLRADLLRAFGRNFYSRLLAPADRPPSVALLDSKVAGFVGTGPAAVYSDPVVEHVADGDALYELRLGTLDTNCVCGPTRLDDLAHTYLGIRKDPSIPEADKAGMRAVFRDPNQTADAYRYAAQDAVITLLVAERMAEQHAELYADFGIPAGAVPPMHGTPGLRVANLMLHHARHTVAAGSAHLGSAGSGAAGLNRLKALTHRGSAGALSGGLASRYGKQTGDTHGGLLYSRTPHAFFHAAPGQFRDVDLGSCYPAIIAPMVAYLGRPVVLEPGHETWTLARAVEYLNEHADGEYAWFVKASGPIRDFANTLVPSTVDALTNDNYRDRDRDRVARKANVRRLDHKSRGWLRGRVDDAKYATLLTDEVNAGVVTAATWLVIRALPPAARRQYENLRAETIVFYPRKLVAASGAEYDALVEKYRTGRAVDWKQELDLGGMTRTTVEDLDETYVSLRYPVGALARRFVERRTAAGKDSAAGKLLKTLSNTVYGAFASPFLPTSNPVAANVITGTARALAYAMALALNGLTVITDGTQYRRDRVPSGTLAERLQRSADYPLLHAADGPFVDPATVPEGDAAFTAWYVGHVMRFFGVEGRNEYESLFRLHGLVHKPLADGDDRVAFDGVFLDGSANYGKLTQTGTGKWEVADLRARSFRKAEKQRLKKWLCRAYAKNTFDAPPPVLKSGRLLGVGDALAQTARATAPPAEPVSAVVPLGSELPTLKTYKLIKPSAFVFRTARQRTRVLADWARLNRTTECGPELLALRRRYGGSLSAVAEKLFALIRSGAEGLKGLNMDRLWRPDSVGRRHGDDVRQGRDAHRTVFVRALVVTGGAVPLTGLVVDRESLAAIRGAADLVR